jgi:hypothetical protein
MSEIPQILFLVNELFLPELARLIILIYAYLPQKFKPGQIVFNSPCGHILRATIHNNFRSLFYPHGKKIYMKAKLLSCKLDLRSLIETYRFCKICDYDFNIFKPQILCFCNQISDTFSCGKCSAQKCDIFSCYRATKNSLCGHHFKCDICRQPYYYECNIPDHDRYWEQLTTYNFLTCNTPQRSIILTGNHQKSLSHKMFGYVKYS